MLQLLAAVISISSNLFLGGFYQNSLIQKKVWNMASSEWELHVVAKLLTTFKHLKEVSTFLVILGKKRAYS